MPAETIYNLFLFCDGDAVVTELGVATHERTGSDEAKLKYLQDMMGADLRRATRHPVPARFCRGTPGNLKVGRFSLDAYQAMSAAGMAADLFEDVFQAVGASASPLMCVTPVENGRPRVEVVVRR